MLRSTAFVRLLRSFLLLILVWVSGAYGYYRLGNGQWTLAECFYQTIITIFTVGFAELPHAEHVHFARSLTAVLVLFGVGAVSYAQASITALLVEGAIGDAYRRSRMQKTIDKIKGHVVVAGVGSTGRHVIEELRAIERPFVVIDRNEAALKEVSAELCNGELLYVVGDATSDHALSLAGLSRAWGVVGIVFVVRDKLRTSTIAHPRCVETLHQRGQ